MKNIKFNKVLWIIFLLAGLTACGGGGSGTPAADTGGAGGSIGGTGGIGGIGGIGGTGGSTTPPSDFLLFKQDGVWRVDIAIDGSKLPAFNPPGTTFTATVNTVEELSIDYIDDANIVLTGCDIAPPVSKTLAQLETESIMSGGPGTTPLLCNTLTDTYTTLGPDQYRIDVACDGQPAATFTFSRISTGTVFNEGTLQLDWTANPGGVPSAVCGAMVRMSGDLTTAGVTTPLTLEGIDVGATYLGNPILLNFQFYENIQTKTYTAGIGPGGVDVFFDVGPLSGGATGGSAQSGSVTITGISSNSASGTYDILLFDGSRISGQFNVAIQ